MATGHCVCRLWTVRKRRKRKTTAACAPETRTSRISATFWEMLLIPTLLKEMPSSSTALVSALRNHSNEPLHTRVSACPTSVCADDSGWWGKGGLFTALEVRSDEPRKQYELAGKMEGNHADRGFICRLWLENRS